MAHPIRDHAFFEKAKLQGLLGYDLFEAQGLLAQILDLARGRGSCGVARQPSLPSFEELLGPAIVQAMSNAFTTTQFRDRVLSLEAIQHDPDLLFGRILSASGSANVFDDLFAVALSFSNVYLISTPRW